MAKIFLILQLRIVWKQYFFYVRNISARFAGFAKRATFYEAKVTKIVYWVISSLYSKSAGLRF
jgi:hypothetical protein